MSRSLSSTSPQLNASQDFCSDYNSLIHACSKGDFDVINICTLPWLFDLDSISKWNELTGVSGEYMHVPLIAVIVATSLNPDLTQSSCDKVVSFFKKHDPNFNLHINNVLTAACESFSTEIFQSQYYIISLIKAHDELKVLDEIDETVFFHRDPNAFDGSRVDLVLTVIQSNGKVDPRNCCGRTALFYACKSLGFGFCKLLVSLGVELNIIDKFGYTAFAYLCKQSNFKLFEFFLSAGIDVNCFDYLGQVMSPNENDYDAAILVQRLIDARANVNYADAQGITALHNGAKSESLVNILIKAKADVNAKSCNGQSPLYYACVLSNAGSVSALIKAGADVNAVNYNGETPLNLTNEKDIKEMLINAGGVYGKERDDEVPLLVSACSDGDFEQMRLLIEQKVDINQRNRDMQTSLHLACSHEYHEAVKILIEAGADVNACAMNNLTPLHIAVSSKDIESSRLLIEAGADVNFKAIIHPFNFFINSAVMINLLLKSGLNSSLKQEFLKFTFYQGDVFSLSMLIDAGVDLDIVNGNGRNLIHCCCLLWNQKKYNRMIKWIINEYINANIAIDSRDTNGFTALHCLFTPSSKYRSYADVVDFYLPRHSELVGETQLEDLLNIYSKAL